MSSTVFRRNGIFAVTESETYAFSQRRLVEPYRRRRRPGYVLPDDEVGPTGFGTDDSSSFNVVEESRKLLPEASPVNKIDTVRSFSNNFLQIQSVMSTGQQATGRSRWSGLEQSQNNFNGQPITGQLISDTGVQSGSTFDNTGNNQNFGTGTIVRSNFRREDDGPNSDYYRCYYNNVPEPLLCEKVAGCCVDGCCPKDVQWLGGIWVLIAFVIAIFLIGFAIAVVCYQRSKSKQKKDAYNSYYAPSQQPYGSEVGVGTVSKPGMPDESWRY